MKAFFEAPQKVKPPRARWRAAATLCVLLSLVACALPGPDIEDAQQPHSYAPKMPGAPLPEQTVRGSDDPPVVTLQLGKSLQQRNLRPAEELPGAVKIGTTNLNNVPLSAAIQAVLADSDIAVLWEDPELQSRPVTLMNLKGALPVVVDRVCRAARVICAYRNGSLEIMATDTFVVELPAVAGQLSDSGASAGTTNTITDAIESLIEGKVKADSSGGNLIYTTNAEGHERVQSYLEQLRNGRPLIVLQLYIWEVSLQKDKALGVNWSLLNLPQYGGVNGNVIANSISNLTSVDSAKSISLGAVFSGAVDANTLVKFLSTQGRVQNISSPQLTFVSGSSAKFEIGGSQRYISQIGTQNTVSGTGSSANSVVTTEELKTGLAISANGSYDNGVVFATLQFKSTDFIQFEEFPAGTVNLKLPETSERTVQTVLRVRPGDNLVLAGLQRSRDERTREGLPTFVAGDIPLMGSNGITNSELVILVRPSVVFFNDRDSLDLHKVADESKGKVNQQLPMPKAPPAPPKEAIRPPSALQDEFGTVVKLYEGTQSGGKEAVKPVATPDKPATPPPAEAEDGT